MPQVSSVCICLLGSAQERAVGRVVNLANAAQNGFRFDYEPRRTVLEKKHRLANGTWDLAAAAAKLVKKERAPTIVFSGEPFGDPDNAGDRDYFLFWDSLRYYGRPDVFGGQHAPVEQIVRGPIGSVPAPGHGIDDARNGNGARLAYRDAQLSDECDDPFDLAGAFEYPWLCQDCESFVAQRLGNSLTPLQLGSVREDERALPRRIVESIYQGIPSSDVVVADLSAANANVYYEVWLAHAWNVDTILRKQGARSAAVRPAQPSHDLVFQIRQRPRKDGEEPGLGTQVLA